MRWRVGREGGDLLLSVMDLLIEINVLLIVMDSLTEINVLLSVMDLLIEMVSLMD